MEPPSEVYSPATPALWRLLTSFAVLIMFCYMVMVFFANMLKRLCGPFELRRLLILHNAICVLLNATSLVVLLFGVWEAGTVVKLVEPNENLRLGILVYWISKNCELLDTVLILLRHSLRQMSLLHVFYHASVVLLTTYSYKYAPWPPIVFLMTINAGTHVIMYGYYALSPFLSLQGALWKKLITQMHLAQFGFGVVYGLYGYMYEGYYVYCIIYPLVMVALLSHSYYNAFILKKKKLLPLSNV